MAIEVKIAFTKSMPPYLHEAEEKGIELEIIEAAFLSQNVKLAPFYNIHYKRASKLLSKKRIDAIVSNMSNRYYYKNSPEIFESSRTLDYMDCAISLKSRNITHEKMSDYSNKTIWAFKSAKEVLGKKFKKAVAKNKHYTENYDQKNMIHMLIRKRVDIVISDRNIFSKTMRDVLGNDSEALFKFKRIIPKTPRNLKFNNKVLNEIFNDGLKKIKSNGTYNKIIDKYKKKYKSEC